MDQQNIGQQNIGHVDIGDGNPFDAGDIREALGFDRDDANVYVRFVPLTRGDEALGLAGGNPGVTAPVTEEVPGDARADRLTNLLETQDHVVGIVMEVLDAFVAATVKHGPMHSAHEGASVIREEYEELWTHVKGDTGKSQEAREEALQLAAMAIRYVLDVVDAPK